MPRVKVNVIQKPHGLSIKNSLTRTPERMAILLLITTIATRAAWLAGLITTLTGKAADFQAHSAKFTRPFIHNFLSWCRALFQITTLHGVFPFVDCSCGT